MSTIGPGFIPATEPIDVWDPYLETDLTEADQIMPWDPAVHGAGDQDYDLPSPLEVAFRLARPPSSVRVSTDAVAYGRLHPSAGRAGMCLRWVRSEFGVPSRYPDAATAWRNASGRHFTSRPLVGAPTFMATRSRFDHIVLASGTVAGAVAVRCLSTDVYRIGYAAEVGLGSLSRAWDAPILGWSETLNGVRVVPEGLILDASLIQYATRHGRRYSHGVTLKRWVWAEVKGRRGAVRMNLATPVLGANFRRNARVLQGRYGLSGPHDGILGLTSLNHLARAHSSSAVVVN